MAEETIPDNSKPVAEIYAGTDECLALIKRIAERYNGDGEDETDHQELVLDFHN